MTSRALGRAGAALAATCSVALSFGLACQPQDIYLFDGAPATTRVDAGARPPEAPPEPPLPMSPPVQEPADAAPPREAPACASAACESCVARDACTFAAATLFCHPATARCSVPCDPGAPAPVPDECPDAERCDPRLGLCVECVDDDDCGASVCDRTSGTCVECNADPDCASTGGLCLREEHRCVQCRVDDDCLIGDDSDLCLPVLFRCGECRFDSDCTSEPDKPFCSTQNECEDERE